MPKWDLRLQTVSLLLALGAVIVAASIGGCTSGQPGASTGANAPTQSPKEQAASGEYALKVTEGGKVLARPSPADIRGLPSLKFIADGKEQEGPSLLSVLRLAGVQDFKRVTVIGMQRGRTHSAALPLDHAKVTDKVILDFNKRGETKLASPEIPSELWIIDVTELEVER